MTQALSTPKKTRLSPLRRKEEFEFYLSILPWIIGFVLFTGGPIVASMFFSLTDWTGLTTRNFIGFQNYIAMFTTDKQFLTVVLSTSTTALPV